VGKGARRRGSRGARCEGAGTSSPEVHTSCDGLRVIKTEKSPSPSGVKGVKGVPWGPGAEMVGKEIEGPGPRGKEGGVVVAVSIGTCSAKYDDKSSGWAGPPFWFISSAK